MDMQSKNISIFGAKFKILKNLILLFLMCFSVSLFSQHKVGVRTGLNYSKYSGPLEPGESYGISNGFHFGISYMYKLPDFPIGFKGELLYTQRGSKQNFLDSLSYLIIDPIAPANLETFIETGKKDLEMDITAGYLSIPLTVHYKPIKKFEFLAGASLDFLVGPSARGNVEFVSKDRPDEIRFIQSLDHGYGSDGAGEYNTFNNENIIILVDGEQVTVPKIIGAYYDFTTEQRQRGNRLNGFNAHLIGGLNYFVNGQFYIGARYEYGLLDVTNNAVDYSLSELDNNSEFIFRDDSDKPYTISISIGFTIGS